MTLGSIPEFILLVVVLGYVVGFVGGLVGLVLGVLRIPIIYGTGFSPSVAAGTNIGISAMGAAAGSFRHIRNRRVDPPVLLMMGTSGAAGAFVGGYYAGLLPDFLLLGTIGVVVLWQGLDLAFRVWAPLQRKEGDAGPTLTEYRVLKELVIGALIGVLGGMVGLILGAIRLPAMIKILKMDPATAVGTNLGAGFMVGISGLIGHLLHGEADLLTLIPMGLAAMVGGYHGAKYTGRLNPILLRRFIGIVLVVVSLGMLQQAYLLITH